MTFSEYMQFKNHTSYKINNNMTKCVKKLSEFTMLYDYHLK